MNTWSQKNKSLRVFLCISVLILSASSAALAQAGRGGVNGLVTDPTGAIVPGARVTVVNHATGVAQHTVTTAAGLYSYVSLTPGVYVVTASQKGFESVAQDNVTVSVDQVSVVNIALRVGSVSEVVTVRNPSTWSRPATPPSASSSLLKPSIVSRSSPAMCTSWCS
jgi:hypothetical protein